MVRNTQHIKKILIANRGEIALRILRSTKEMGIFSGVVYAENECNALFVSEADGAYPLGIGSLSDTYLNIEKIINIAIANHFDAIHPGYGFLSENAQFAQACKNNNIVFIGPSAESIKLMGNKIEALNYVESLGVPVLKSIKSVTTDALLVEAKNLEFPLIIKAAAGGGGKGMRVVKKQEELSESIEAASREALSYFGNAEVFIEKYIESPRHIEVQVLGDMHGNVVHLFERECTIQRRHQKIIEEAPSVTLNDQIREKLYETAINIAQSMSYVSAGTIEFLVDEHLQFYFLEMNTRIQVEHPVTEVITGVDIVHEQINIAMGNSISFLQNQVKINGHAIQCRLYAEDAFNGFLPSSGSILIYSLPLEKQVRVDSSINGASEILPDYDPMIAKIIAHSSNRSLSIKKMSDYLKKSAVLGIQTNLDYLKEVLSNQKFIDNQISTNFCKLEADHLFQKYIQKLHQLNTKELIGSVLSHMFPGDIEKFKTSAWKKVGYWRQKMSAVFEIFETIYHVSFQKIDSKTLVYSVNNEGETYTTHTIHSSKTLALFSRIETEIYCYYNHLHFNVFRKDSISLNSNKKNIQEQELINCVIAPINGKVCKINVKPNDKVNKGDIILVIESMKMENNILAPREGKINEIKVNVGDRVSGKEIIALLI